METNAKITGWISTDGKMSLSWIAETSKESDKLFDELKPTFEKMIKLMKDNDLKPSRGGSPFPPKKEKDWIEGRKCPKCQGRVYRSKYMDKRSGIEKEMTKCENNKWDPIQKKNVGLCDFVDWPLPTQGLATPPGQ